MNSSSDGSPEAAASQLLYAGCGYGGSCFPKDVKALLHSAQGVGEPLHVLAAVERANDRQKQVLATRVVQRFGEDLSGRRIAVWGLAFKPDTDDLREAPSRALLAELAARGAAIVAHDPEAMEAARAQLGDTPRLEFAPTPMAALEGADALVIVTEWRAYRSPDFERMRRAMRTPVIIDGRNLFDTALLRDAGFEYQAIGRRAPAATPEAWAMAA